jgi:hypothetical protein
MYPSLRSGFQKKAVCENMPPVWLIAECRLLIADCYRPDPAAIFFTMASTSLRSLSFRLRV